jgi:hypothetical protein
MPSSLTAALQSIALNVSTRDECSHVLSDLLLDLELEDALNKTIAHSVALTDKDQEIAILRNALQEFHALNTASRETRSILGPAFLKSLVHLSSTFTQLVAENEGFKKDATKNILLLTTTTPDQMPQDTIPLPEPTASAIVPITSISSRGRAVALVSDGWIT